MKKTKWKIILAAVIVALVVANHVEYYFRAKRLEQRAQHENLPVVQLATSAAGHSSIEIDENSLTSRDFLHFATLESWAFTKDRPTPCPPSVMQVNGQKVRMMGFMFPLQPLQDGGDLKVFCLLRSTQTCCYGPRPQYNQYVFVEMPEAVKFERMSPVVAEGTFVVDPKPDDGYIYRLEGKSVRAAGNNEEPPTAEEFAKQNNLPVFDFSPLEAAKAASDTQADIAKLSSAIDGKEMVLHGYLVGRTKDTPPKIMVGAYAWDGKAIGTPPGLYNTVMVSPKDARQLPPLWWQEAVFKGTAHVTKEASDRPKSGVVHFDNASLALGAASGPRQITDIGPYLPLSCELIIVAAYFATLAMGLISKVKQSPSSPLKK
jgi:hypothetical protein